MEKTNSVNMNTKFIFFKTVSPKNLDLISRIEKILFFFKEVGVVPTKMERLIYLAGKGWLFAAFDEDNFVGCSAITAEYSDGSFEFGSWAVATEYQKMGIGTHLLKQTLEVEILKGKKVISVANNYSGPIFSSLGYKEIPQDIVHPDYFLLCKECCCHGKELLSGNRKCVDTFYLLQDC